MLEFSHHWEVCYMTMVQYLTPPLTKQVHRYINSKMPLLWAIQRNFTILLHGQIWLSHRGLSFTVVKPNVRSIVWKCLIITPCKRARGKLIGQVHLSSLSVSLSVCRHKFSRSRVFFSPKYPSNIAKCWKTTLYVIHFARYTLQMLKSFWVSIMGTPIDYTQIVGHVLNVQPETTVSVFRGFSLQHAFVRQWFVLCTCIATWHMGHMLYIVSYQGSVGGGKNGLVSTACVCAACVWG